QKRKPTPSPSSPAAAPRLRQRQSCSRRRPSAMASPTSRRRRSGGSRQHECRLLAYLFAYLLARSSHLLACLLARPPIPPCMLEGGSMRGGRMPPSRIGGRSRKDRRARQARQSSTRRNGLLFRPAASEAKTIFAPRLSKPHFIGISFVQFHAHCFAA